MDVNNQAAIMVSIERISIDNLSGGAFNEADLAELTESIKSNGILNPIIVNKNGDDYELVAGIRRLIAAKYAGFTEVPVIVKGKE